MNFGIKKLCSKIYHIFSKMLSSRTIIELRYFRIFRKKLNLKKPQRFSEKLCWYNLYYRDPLMTKCADKYLLNNYAQECGLGFLKRNIYGVYQKFDDIDFDKLPNRFYIKCNHYSNGNYLYDKSKKQDLSSITKRFNSIMKSNYYWINREWCYKDIVPYIICEEVIETDDDSFVDYNFFCFNGEPEFVFYNVGLADSNGIHKVGYRAVIDKNFNEINVTTGQKKLEWKYVKKPKEFEEMLNYARKLSAPFPHVRVDFFYTSNKIYLAEMTFVSGGGYSYLEPKNKEIEMVQNFDVPIK